MLFEHKCVLAVCVHIYPYNDKNPPSVFFFFIPINNIPFLKSSRSQLLGCVTSRPRPQSLTSLINTNALCANVSSRQSKCIIFCFPNCLPIKRFLALFKDNVAKATIVSDCFHWCCLHVLHVFYIFIRLVDVSLHRIIISIHFPLIYAIWWALTHYEIISLYEWMAETRVFL